MRRPTLFLLGLVLVTLTGLPATASQLPGTSWYEGAEGFEQAIREAQREEKPIFVYFRTDWCPYCRQFEDELLDTEEVELFLRKVVRVTVNPESGPGEMQIASSYGVQGYPAMFVHPATLGQARVVQRVLVQDGQPRLMTPVEFVQTLSRAAHD